MTSQRCRPGRPATGQTPTRSVRVGDVWDRAREIAARRGETMTAVITRALRAREVACIPTTHTMWVTWWFAYRAQVTSR